MTATRNGTLLWIGRGVSLLGNRFTDLVLPWAVLAATHSAWATGAVLACQQLPLLLLALPVGAWIEGRPTKTVALAAEFARVMVMVGLSVAVIQRDISVPLVAGLAFVLGTSAVFFGNAFGVIMVHTVGRSRVTATHNLIEGADAVSLLIGPPLAGLVLLRFGAQWALTLDAASFLVSFLTVAGMQTGEPLADVHAGRLRDHVAVVKAGVAYVWADGTQRMLAGIGAALGYSAVALAFLTIVVARQHLHLSAASTGLLFSAMGIGDLIGVALQHRLGERLRWTVLLAAQLATAAVASGALVFAHGAVGTAIAVLVADGGLSMAFVVHAGSTQTVTPDALLARVGSIRTATDGVARLFAQLSIGACATYLGTSSAFGVLSVVLGTATVMLTLARRRMKGVHPPLAGSIPR